MNGDRQVERSRTRCEDAIQWRLLRQWYSARGLRSNSVKSRWFWVADEADSDAFVKTNDRVVCWLGVEQKDDVVVAEAGSWC